MQWACHTQEPLSIGYLLSDIRALLQDKPKQQIANYPFYILLH